LDVSRESNTSLTLSGDNIEGAVIADGSVVISSRVVSAPELPRVIMAGLASLIVFGRAGLEWKRRCRRERKETSDEL
jgi:hypothetical protein